MPAAARRDTRSRLLAAAAAEFAARGFAGANVDLIARRAGVNKAMIYYHFRSKLALYREILREMYAATGTRVSEIARGRGAPSDKLRAFVAALTDEARARPHFPPIILRELAEKGTHIDEATLRLVGQIPQALAAIVREGRARGEFRPVPPLALLVTIVGPIVFFFASAPVRARLARLGLIEAAEVEPDQIVPYLQEMALQQVGAGSRAEPAVSERST